MGAAVANVFLGPVPDKEKAWMFLAAAPAAAVLLGLAYDTWKDRDIIYIRDTITRTTMPGMVHIKAERRVWRLNEKALKDLMNGAKRATKGISGSIFKMASKSGKSLLAGGIIAALSAILLGFLDDDSSSKKLPFTDVLMKIAISALKLCYPKPIIIPVDSIQLSCHKLDEYLKEQLTRDAYTALQELIKENKIETCSPDSPDWIELFLDIEIAKLGKMTFEEGLRDTELPIPTLHYVLFLEKISALNKGGNKEWKFGEAEMVCWWNLIRFRGKKKVSYYKEIYGKVKEVYDSGDVNNIDTSKNICWMILEELGKSKEDILTNSEGNNYIAPFSDENSCTGDIKECAKGRYVASSIESSNYKTNSIAVNFYHAVGRLLVYLVHYNVE